MQHHHTVEDIVQWILTNRKEGSAFKGYTEHTIRKRLLEATDNGELMITTNNKGEIFGVAVYKRVLHVEHVLTTQPCSLGILLNNLYARFPGFIGQAFRKGKLVRYNNPKRLQQLTFKL